MKLVHNWKKILLKSYSMWAAYLGIALLLIPEVFYLTQGYQLLSPYLSGYGGFALLVVGVFGRIIDQGIASDD